MTLEELQKLIGKTESLVAYHLASKINLQDETLTFIEWQSISIHHSGNAQIKEIAVKKMCETATTIEDFRALISESPKTSEAKKEKILERAAKIATTFYDWEFIAYYASDESNLKKQAHEKMRECQAVNFLEWKGIYSSRNDQTCRQIALEKMQATATKTHEWLEIYELSIGNEENENLALARIGNFDLNFNEWLGIYRSHHHAKIRSLARRKMMQKASSYKEWETICTQCDPDQEQRVIALKEMEKSNQPFDKWRQFYDCTGNHSVKELALSKMISGATTFAQWELLASLIYEGSVKDLTLQQMNNLATTFGEWYKLFIFSPINSNYRKTAWTKMQEANLAIETWINIYRKYPHDQVKELALQKIAFF